MFEDLNRLKERSNREWRILCSLVSNGISKEFDVMLSGKDDEILGKLRDGQIKILKAKTPNEFLRMAGLDLTTLLDILENKPTFSYVEGIIIPQFFSDRPAEPIIILKDEPQKDVTIINPKGLADKVCHEMIHYLGFNIIEILKVENGRIKTEEIKEKIKSILSHSKEKKGEIFAESFEESIKLLEEILNQIFSEYTIEGVVLYRLGPLIDLGILFSMKNAPEIKVFFILFGDPESAFWEGVVDYYSKKIINKLDLEGKYIAGYDQRFLIQLIMETISNLLSEITQKSYEEIFEEIDKLLKISCLSGKETELQKIIDLIEPQKLYEKMKLTLERMEHEEKYREWANIVKHCIESFQSISDYTSSYQWIKDFILYYVDYLYQRNQEIESQKTE